MTDIFQNLSQPSWWLSVVLAGIVVNLLAAYMKPQLDKRVARFSSSRRSRLALAQKEREEVIEELATDRVAFVEWQLDMLFSTLVASVFLLLSLLVLLATVATEGAGRFSAGIIGTVRLVATLLAIAMFLRRGRQAVMIGHVLTEAARLREERRKQSPVQH